MNDRVNTAWNKLADLPKPTLAELFADSGRLAAMATDLDLPGGKIRFDWSKTHLDAAHVAAFDMLALAAGFDERRAAFSF